MAHRMGFYKLQAKAFNGKPAYKYHSDSFGDAFLYSKFLENCFWDAAGCQAWYGALLPWFLVLSFIFY